MRALASALGAEVIGQSDAIDALVTALVAREHVYLGGAPGCGKTRLAERFAELASERTATVAFHRDSTLSDLFGSDLFGNADLERERRPGAERLRLRAAATAFERAEVVVLDDPAHASPSVLGPLWSRLDTPPLETAVATGRALLEEEPGLSSAALERFAVRVHVRGLVARKSLADARRLLDSELPSSAPRLPASTRRDAQDAALALSFPREARDALAAALRELRMLCGAEAGLYFTDRFARRASRLMRAHALLRGAHRVEPRDVAVLRFTLHGRVPEAELERANQVLEAPAGDHDERAPVAGAGGRPGPGGGAAAAEAPDTPAIRDVELEVAPGAVPSPAGDVEPLVHALEGAFARGASAQEEKPGGMPRDYRRLRTLDELFDADPSEAWRFATGSSADPPRVLRRERAARGGAVAVLRDVSASMEGRLARFAGDVVRALAHVGEKRDLRLAYVEFHHEAERYVARGRPFHRRYRAIAALGARRRAEGRTSYAAPLRAALGALARAPDRSRHVLLLTDGVPVAGDPHVRRERRQARALGVKIHTVFIGTGECPSVLDDLSRETDGLRFRAYPLPGGAGLRIEARAA